MSGPKLIELRRMRAARERQQDHDLCAGFGSEYTRLFAELQEWGKRLARLGVAVTETVRPLERIQVEVNSLLDQGMHHEAARIFGEEVTRVRTLVEQRRTLFQERMVLLQNRHRQFLRDCETLAAERSALEERLRQAVPVGWPDVDRKRIADLTTPALQQSVPRAPSEFPDTAQAIADFEKLEAAIGSSLSEVRGARQKFEAELSITHAALLGRATESGTAASPSLKEVLQRFKPSQPAPVESTLSGELEKLLAELATFSADSFLQDVRSRAVAISVESDPARRRLLSDAVMIDCNGRLKQLRNLDRWREELEALIDTAAHLKDASVDAAVADLRRLLASEQIVDLEPVKRQFQAVIAGAEARREREYKRRALVESLKELGYETNEGLETALVKEGRLILRRADEEDYAVEMVANPELNQLQTALVRYADSAEMTEQQRRRDREREESWCEDHARLREKMAQRGLETEFKMQMKPGEHPVKVVVDETRSQDSRRGMERDAGEKYRSASE